MQHVIVDIFISREEWMRIYRGETNLVYAKTRDGRSIQFPANVLKKYTTQNGIKGSFAIYFNDQGKFQSVVQL